ncbi:MAG: PAS domain-containing protein [Pseudomonadales bacterium]|nr:PAS domain-containing protein [Pseudomonadales bacterium]
MRQAFPKPCWSKYPDIALLYLLLTPTFLYAEPLVSENESDQFWGGFFFLLIFFCFGIAFPLWRLFRKEQQIHNDLDAAYRSLETRVNERTQKLREINNELYAEINKHKETEVKLRQNRAYLQSIINSMPSIIIGITTDNRITHFNRKAEEMSGMSEQAMLGQSLWEAIPEFMIPPGIIKDAIAQKKAVHHENHKYTLNDETRFSDITIYPLISENLTELIIRIDDVTLQHLMENRAVQNEKMLSLGEMAAGMAHEINNPLGAIIQNVQNIKRRFSPELSKNKSCAKKLGVDLEQINRYLEERGIIDFLNNIRDAGDRSAKIVSNMLEFSYSGQNHVLIDINEIVKHCIELSESGVRKTDKKIIIETLFTDTAPLVRGSPGEIQQVIFNLIKNATQSFASKVFNEHEVPRITLKTTIINDQCSIEIIDNGCGIPPNILNQIFTPFFTTKEIGQGTGLGLSICYFIITEHHKGHIEVSSKEGCGTHFTITLPLDTETQAKSHG